MFRPKAGNLDEQNDCASAERRASCSARALGLSSSIHLFRADCLPLMCGCKAVTLPEIIRNNSAGPGFLASPSRLRLLHAIHLTKLV